MAWRKLFVVFATFLLSVGSAFAFPHDPNPSSIDATGGWGTGSARFSGFTGDWTRNFGSMTRANGLILEYMNQEFKKTGGPGGSHDLNIWNTPGFRPDRMEKQERAWTHMLANPGQNANAIARSEFTTHDELISFVEDLPKTNLTIGYLGEIPRGFPFPVLVFSTSKDRTPEGLKKTGKPLVWIQGLIHGGEWSGGEGATAMAYDLATGRYDEILEKINVIILPRVNADGARRATRESYDTLALQWTASPEARDLNRDHLTLDHPVSRAMKKMLNAYSPHFSVDLHERGASNGVETVFGRRMDTDAGDLGTAGATSMQLPQDFLALRYEHVEPELGKAAAEYGVWFGLYREDADTNTWGHTSVSQYYDEDVWMQPWTDNGVTTTWVPEHPDNVAGYENFRKGIYATTPPTIDYGRNGTRMAYVTSTDFDPNAPYWTIHDAVYNPRNSRNNNAMRGVISQLFENKGGNVIFERRVAAGYVAMLATLRVAAAKADWWVETLEEMRTQWVEKGKTVSTDDMVTIISLPPKHGPTFWGEAVPEMGFNGHNIPWTVVDVQDAGYTGNAPVTPEDIAKVKSYDSTRAMKYVGADDPNAIPGTKADAYALVTDNSAPRASEGGWEMFKFVQNWQGHALRERVRPYAYLIDGGLAQEIATRMMLNGIEFHRLAADTEVEVEAHKFNQQIYIDNSESRAPGWRNRDVTLYKTTKLFKKDETLVVYLAQPLIHQIPTYLEPDMPWSAAGCTYLPLMSLALGGAGERGLHVDLIGMEMPVYRYLKEVDLPTYPLHFSLPLVNRGAVPRFFEFPTQEVTKAVAEKIKETTVRVYNYDFQVHTRTDALIDGKFDIMLPTNSDTKGYMIRKSDGTYEELLSHGDSLGFNIATVVIADHGIKPFTVDLGEDGKPLVVDGNNRTLAFNLPPSDDLIGMQIVEVLADSNKVVDTSVQAVAMRLPGSPRLTITVTEILSDGSKSNLTLTTAGSAGVAIYSVGPYSVSVDAQGSAMIVPAEIVGYSGDGYKYN